MHRQLCFSETSGKASEGAAAFQWCLRSLTVRALAVSLGGFLLFIQRTTVKKKQFALSCQCNLFKNNVSFSVTAEIQYYLRFSAQRSGQVFM